MIGAGQHYFSDKIVTNKQTNEKQNKTQLTEN